MFAFAFAFAFRAVLKVLIVACVDVGLVLACTCMGAFNFSKFQIDWLGRSVKRSDKNSLDSLTAKYVSTRRFTNFFPADAEKRNSSMGKHVHQHPALFCFEFWCFCLFC